MPEVLFRDLGVMDYKEAWDYQEALFEVWMDYKRRVSQGGRPVAGNSDPGRTVASGNLPAEEQNAPENSTGEEQIASGNSTDEAQNAPGNSTGEEQIAPGNSTDEEQNAPGNSTDEEQNAPGNSPAKELIAPDKSSAGSPVEQDNGGERCDPPLQYLLFVEHPHVYTLGKSGDENNMLIHKEFLKKINATYYKINRGGDITYHGPGQIVGYPILDLESHRMGLKAYIGFLEESIIALCRRYGIEATQSADATGVWIDADHPRKARKICAIGVRTSRYVTMHGFAFNVNTDLDYFTYINPCGFQEKGVTSMEKELGKKMDMDRVKAELKEILLHRLNP
jgi:lipoyl(octanoyl) transferase